MREITSRIKDHKRPTAIFRLPNRSKAPTQANTPRNDRLDRNWDLNLGTFDSDSDSVCLCSCQGPGASVSIQLGLKLPLTLVDVFLCDRCLPTPTSALSERCVTQLQDTLTVALRSLCYGAGAGAGAGGGKPSLFTVGFTALQHPLGRPMACDSIGSPRDRYAVRLSIALFCLAFWACVGSALIGEIRTHRGVDPTRGDLSQGRELPPASSIGD
ncbi:hypothetical protein BKA56DRAFT_13143 [Ilyonectria sp. MPI-CAGE-AT-0026]|nr:hypothetical protein BKA56DRAFT_13143 [Ilyonectria sp. MPI-CAGE-AT-0026]